MGLPGIEGAGPRTESELEVKKVLVVLAVATALFTSGCSQVGAAATLGDQKITEATVQASIDSILAERGKIDTNGMNLATGSELNRAQLRFHVLTTLLQDIAGELKIKASATEIAARREAIIAQVGGEAALPQALVGAQIAPADFDQYLSAIIISDKLGQGLEAQGLTADEAGQKISELVVAKAAKLKVTINPRYGKWDPTAGDIVDAVSGKSAVTTVSNG